MANVGSSLDSFLQIRGTIAVAIVDMKSGATLGSAGDTSLDMGAAAAGSVEVMRLYLQTLDDLKLHQEIDDVLITLGSQYHMLRLIQTEDDAVLLLYMVQDRYQTNLPQTRHRVAQITQEMRV